MGRLPVWPVTAPPSEPDSTDGGDSDLGAVTTTTESATATRFLTPGCWLTDERFTASLNMIANECQFCQLSKEKIAFQPYTK
jgi:hypothetical protein